MPVMITQATTLIRTGQVAIKIMITATVILIMWPMFMGVLCR